MAVEAIVALMVDKLGKLLDKGGQLGVDGEIKHIRDELNKMGRFLKDADIKQKENEAVRGWMKNIRDICFDVDAVIDAIIFSQAAQGRHGFVERLKRRISDQITRYKVGKEIERIKLNIKDISRSIESYGTGKINEGGQEATSTTQRLQQGSGCSDPPKELPIPITKEDDQLIKEERTKDTNEGKGIQEASSSAPSIQADRLGSTQPGESEEVGLQEIDTVGEQLMKKEPSHFFDTFDDFDKLFSHMREREEQEAQEEQAKKGFLENIINSALRLPEVSRCSVPPPPEKIEEVINTVNDRLTNEERTRDIDEGRLEASSSAPSIQADRLGSTQPGESEEVGLQEIDTAGEQLMKKDPSHFFDTFDDFDKLVSHMREREEQEEQEQEAQEEEEQEAQEAQEEEEQEAQEAQTKKRVVENVINSAPRLPEVSRCSIPPPPPPPPEKIEEVITTVNDRLTNEERTRDIDEGRQEASTSSRNLQAHRPVSTLPGEQEEVGLQEEINTVGQQLIEEERGPWDFDEGVLEASSSAPSIQADRWFSTQLGESEEVGLQEEIDRVSEQLIKEEPSHCDDTSDVDEGSECRDGSKDRKMQPKWSEQVLASSKPSLEGPPDDGCSWRKYAQKETLGAKHPRAYYHHNVQGCEATKHVQRPQEDPSTFQKRQISSKAVVPYIIGKSSEAVVSYIVRKLGELLIQEAQLLFGVRVGVEWIKNELEWMQCFLKDADSKQNEDVRVKKWVSDIIDVSYEIEDVIETFINRLSRRHGLARCLKRYIREHKVAKLIEQIKQKISDISRRRETYVISNINEGRQEASSWIRDLEGCRRDSVMFEEAQLVGQHEEFRTVRDQLMTEEQRRSVISIFGIGGSGKTALAKKILNDVKDHFDCHALVYVSRRCKIKDVLVSIIKGVAGDSTPMGIENLDEVELGMMLRDKYLRWKRYLVVIDDVWTREAWDSLILKLPDDGNKSRVLVTTRIRDVALHADPSGRHHEMRLLNEDESWELFMKKIFSGKDPTTTCPSELEEIRWKILKKCGGLPLAILVLGGLLVTKDKKERAWSRVLENIPESSKQCMDILALSYWDLPPYLKPCFLYFGLFPEDYEISSGKMIRLWIAEGFIEQRDGEIMEDVGEDYLEDLVSRSMIQVASRKSNGSINKCRIHDLLHELSISEARENNFFTVHNDKDTSSSSTSVRRLAFYCNIDGDETKNRSLETLRSILYFLGSKVDVLKLVNTGCKLLRVMNYESEECSDVSLPREVGKFVHLKFLEFSRTHRFRSIPPSIGNLSSLQTLKVFEDPGKGILPNTIWNLKELRHLHAYFHIKGDPHLSNLRNLQTLCLIAGSWIKEGLGNLTNLRKLGIFGDVSSYHDTLPYCIEKLRELRSLKLQCVGPIPPFMPFTHHLDLYKIYLCGSITKLLELPPKLVELFLEDSDLKQDAISTLEKLQHLKILKLRKGSYLSKQMTCSQGGFPRLEVLELCHLPLEEWIVKEGAMISLKSVELVEMSALKTETLPERVHAFLREGEPV